jgi:hypothetical protein
MMRVLLLLCLTSLVPVCLADEKPVAPPPRVQFWSGTVTELAAGRVVIRRKLPNRDPEERQFVITPDTKVEGALAVESRVVIGYVQSNATAVARRIVIRSSR